MQITGFHNLHANFDKHHKMCQAHPYVCNQNVGGDVGINKSQIFDNKNCKALMKLKGRSRKMPNVKYK